jgi:nitroimidazol reductase NimA-like FMN-containing flavoprotein (pyridoxamine 5'-phosphate oxidase superfamily)
MSSTSLSTTPRTRLSRFKERGRDDRTALYEILDEGLICHIGLVVNGTPRVLPTGYGRLSDTLYLHGSTGATSMLAAPSQEICVTVTLLDGLVAARSLMHHSMNYRSAVIFGTPRLVSSEDERLAGLRAITENLIPGQWDVARQPNKKEMAQVAVLALPLEEASVKVRQGPPGDDAEDLSLDVWAGVLPVRQVVDSPVPDPTLRPGIPLPRHLDPTAG